MILDKKLRIIKLYMYNDKMFNRFDEINYGN